MYLLSHMNTVAALVMKSKVGLRQSGKAIHGNCWEIGYPLGSHLEPKFRLIIKSISLSQSIYNFPQSTELSLPCSVKSCEMTGQVRNIHGQWDFARFAFNMSFGRVWYIATVPGVWWLPKALLLKYNMNKYSYIRPQQFIMDHRPL